VWHQVKKRTGHNSEKFASKSQPRLELTTRNNDNALTKPLTTSSRQLLETHIVVKIQIVT